MKLRTCRVVPSCTHTRERCRGFHKGLSLNARIHKRPFPPRPHKRTFSLHAHPHRLYHKRRFPSTAHPQKAFPSTALHQKTFSLTPIATRGFHEEGLSPSTPIHKDLSLPPPNSTTRLFLHAHPHSLPQRPIPLHGPVRTKEPFLHAHHKSPCSLHAIHTGFHKRPFPSHAHPQKTFPSTPIHKRPFPPRPSTKDLSLHAHPHRLSQTAFPSTHHKRPFPPRHPQEPPSTPIHQGFHQGNFSLHPTTKDHFPPRPSNRLPQGLSLHAHPQETFPSTPIHTGFHKRPFPPRPSTKDLFFFLHAHPTKGHFPPRPPQRPIPSTPSTQAHKVPFPSTPIPKRPFPPRHPQKSFPSLPSTKGLSLQPQSTQPSPRGLSLYAHPQNTFPSTAPPPPADVKTSSKGTR
ncbi:hypothetical protein C7M84_008504 [Penaeus vannamei]|uniref:Uncharacterized protein n=1 Tax=Penaeus vannamei TaxID=6689 RepID=A0A3R7PIK9_PENVA|nr:hypothetical protein C7M84_008504 [Penaeus vannamei]